MKTELTMEYENIVLFINGNKYIDFGNVDDILSDSETLYNRNATTDEIAHYLVYDYFKSLNDDYKNDFKWCDYFYQDYIELNDDDYKKVYDDTVELFNNYFQVERYRK